MGEDDLPDTPPTTHHSKIKMYTYGAAAYNVVYNMLFICPNENILCVTQCAVRKPVN